MNPLNSSLIEGIIDSTPELRTTPKGTTVCVFSIESTRFYKDDNGKLTSETSVFDIEAWGRLAEKCDKELSIGRGVRVVGRLKQDRWAGSDGLPHSRVKVIAEHVEIKPQKKPQSQGEDFTLEA